MSNIRYHTATIKNTYHIGRFRPKDFANIATNILYDFFNLVRFGNVTSAITMAWEARETRNAQRMRWAQLVLRERFLATRQLTFDVSEPVWMSTVLEADAKDSQVADVNLF